MNDWHTSLGRCMDREISLTLSSLKWAVGSKLALGETGVTEIELPPRQLFSFPAK